MFPGWGRAVRPPGTLPIVGNGSRWGPWRTPRRRTSPPRSTGGGRLKRLRTQRGMTLTEVAEATGISKSTMSGWRPASGGPPWNCSSRCPRPTGAAGRPRRSSGGGRSAPAPQARPGQGPDGDTADPAARRHAGVENRHPDQQGRPGAPYPRRPRMDLRPVRTAAFRPRPRGLGPRAGEVASFDTTVPHWFGSTGDDPQRSSASRATRRTNLRPNQSDTPVRRGCATAQRSGQVVIAGVWPRFGVRGSPRPTGA